MQQGGQEVHCTSADRHQSQPEGKLEEVVQDEEIQATGLALEKNKSQAQGPDQA